jgi:hypothetical protein
MPTNIFEEIDTLQAEWSRMDKVARLGWLTGRRMRLIVLASQLSQYVRARGGFLNDTERSYAHNLMEMIQSVDAEGAKTLNELKTDAVKELLKLLIHG